MDMASEPHSALSRRAFLRLSLRLAALGGLAWLGRSVARRDGPLPPEPCPSGGACRGCPRRRSCGLPRGLGARAVLGGGAPP